jgi:hypothetical protein
VGQVVDSMAFFGKAVSVSTERRGQRSLNTAAHGWGTR